MIYLGNATQAARVREEFKRMRRKDIKIPTERKTDRYHLHTHRVGQHSPPNGSESGANTLDALVAWR
jgi:hypothetical protein